MSKSQGEDPCARVCSSSSIWCMWLILPILWLLNPLLVRRILWSSTKHGYKGSRSCLLVWRWEFQYEGIVRFGSISHPLSRPVDQMLYIFSGVFTVETTYMFVDVSLLHRLLRLKVSKTCKAKPRLYGYILFPRLWIEFCKKPSTSSQFDILFCLNSSLFHRILNSRCCYVGT